jgi:streptogramin lyase
MADAVGNIFIADKDSHSILKVTPDGTIHTAAGTHIGGFNGDGPAVGTSLQLNLPNGEWVRSDGTVYILDTGNGRVRRLDTNQIMTTLFTVSGGIDVGRGLWVKDDESLVYFASGTSLKKWTPAGGVKTIDNAFVELGNLAVDSAGQLVVTDRGANLVYRISSNGSRTAIAGNGGVSGGGDGFAALLTALAGVRGVWFLPNGGYLLATHEGSQVWHVDPAGIIRLFVDGLKGNVHSGDGEFFRSPGYKLTEVRSVTLDTQGNVWITENDYGYIRRIRFQRLQP